jgi:tetratricopeptide (TPR) repeat protein
LPAREIARILRSGAEPKPFVDALMGLATSAADARSYERFLFQAAEANELALGDDKAALQCLAQADSVPESVSDPAVIEATERIHLRAENTTELRTLYARWIARQPQPNVDYSLRIALAELLAEASPKEAVLLLDGIVQVIPHYVPALRVLEQLHRVSGGSSALASVLRAEALAFKSGPARAGALWELASIDKGVDEGSVLDALERISAEDATDTAALDATIGVAGKLLADLATAQPMRLLARNRLVASLEARRRMEADALARAGFEIEEALLSDQASADDARSSGRALASYRAAIADWPESVVAARGVERFAEKLGDREALIASKLALARLSPDAAARADNLVRAANLTLEGQTPSARTDALALYDEALRAHPDCVAASRACAAMLADDVPRLVDQLGSALGRATQPEQVLLLGMEIGRAVLSTTARDARPRNAPVLAGAAAPPPSPEPNAIVGVAAVRRVLEHAPENVSALLLMAQLLVAAKAWSEARDVLLRAVSAAPAQDLPSRVMASLLLAELYETRLNDLPRAQAAIEAVLARSPAHRDALSALHRVATALGNVPLAIQSLRRLADVTPDPASRVEVDLRLADACRDAGDAEGRVRALADAVVTSPDDPRATTLLAHLFRSDTKEGALRHAAALTQILEIAGARRLPVDPRWLTSLGMLEVTVLQRVSEGLSHLRQASLLPGAPPDTHVALGRGLEAANQNAEAVRVFRGVLTSDAEVLTRITDLASALASLDAALAKDGRVEERLAVEEARACLGELSEERLAPLRARRLADGTPFPGALADANLVQILVPEARTPILNVATILGPVAAKILRFELSGLGVTSRDRLGLRDGHPTRVLAERLSRVFGLEAFELYLSPSWQGALRVYPGDPPAIVGSTQFAELPEPEQLFALGRLLARIAIGPSWLDEVPLEAFDGLLIAAVRAVHPELATGAISAARDAMAQSYAASVQRALGRRQRKLLEELVPTVTTDYDPRTVAIGVRRSEYRAAYVLCGSVLAAIEYLQRFDREVGRSLEEPRVLLQHPVTNELIRYALSEDAFFERRRLGTAGG